MDIKSLAKPYEWQGATLWFMPYRTPHIDIAVRALNELEPEMVYVNTKTGERVTEEPDALTKAKAKYAETRRRHMERWASLNQKPDEAMLAQVVVKSEWVEERNWTLIHDTFYLCMPSIVAIDFPDFDENIATELRVFAAYWKDPGKTIADRWNCFKLIIGTATLTALWNGFAATRDNPAPAKPELGQVEPKNPLPESNGSESEPSTTDSSKRRRKRRLNPVTSIT
jgi:hypothetical protein